MAKECQYNKIVKYLIVMQCEQPFHAGSAEGDIEEMLVHPVTGRPFLQGSSITGAIREYCQTRYGEEAADSLFGNPEVKIANKIKKAERQSKVKITDGILVPGHYKTELRPHIRICGRMGTVEEAGLHTDDAAVLLKTGQKFAMQYIAAGEQFAFRLYYFYKKEECSEAGEKEALENCLCAIQEGGIQFGARKSTGCGIFSIVNAKRKSYDLQQEQDRHSWLMEEDAEEGYEDFSKQVQSQTGGQYRLELHARAEQGILVKSILPVLKDSKAITAGLQNGRDAYILPGSSIKGVLRNRVEMIADFLGLDKGICEEIFGTEASENNQGFMGSAYFCDSVIEKAAPLDQAHIHIDKFTGGTFDGGLFQERLVAGDIQLQIRVKDGANAKRSCGLLLLALRDLALQEIGFGSGSAVGHGFLEVVDYSILASGQKATVHWDSKKEMENEQIILECLHALKTQEEPACVK